MSVFWRKKGQGGKNKGAISILVLVFAGVFIVLIGGMTGFVLTQNRLQTKKEAKELAFQIAEAGLNYYKWFLAHYPNDLTDGTGGPGPYEHEYSDPEGGPVGKFSLEIEGNTVCGALSSIDITSTGWTYKEPSIQRTVRARYARPSVAEYAYIIDSNVWAGSDRQIKGKYHSNGGIRMDGENDSLVTSAVEEWNCTPSFGCDSPYEVKPGIFGSGGGSDLWRFPVEPIDFNGISVDLAQMKEAAQNYGIYIPPSGRYGYHVVFKNDGTLDVYRVTSVRAVRSYNLEEGSFWSYEVIRRESFYNSYSVPADCGLIFIEDNLWVEGVVKGKITIASADLIHPNTDTNVWLEGNINYTTTDGSDGLLVIGEKNVRIPLYSPNQMELRGIFLAQKGHFGRDYYSCTWYYPWCIRDRLEITGSIVSKGRVGTKWSCWWGFCSGYAQRENSYDRKLMSSPPPMTPFSDDEYGFIDWEEVE